jgi:hypothetical protein
MIEKVRSVSRITEVDNVGKQIVTAIEPNGWSDDTHLSQLLTRLAEQCAALNKAIMRTKAESDLDDKDGTRDARTRSIFYLTQGFLHHPEEAIKQAAENINVVFERYGLEMVTKSNAIQSSLTASLLMDLSSEEIAADIDSLPGMKTLISQLDLDQKAFIEAEVKLLSERARDKEEENASQLKKEVLDTINNQLVVYLRAMNQVDEAKYGQLCNTVAQIIETHNSIVKRRSN